MKHTAGTCGQYGHNVFKNISSAIISKRIFIRSDSNFFLIFLDKTNKKDPKPLLMLAAETTAENFSKIKLNLNSDQLWIVFKVLSRGNNMEDHILQRIVQDSESRFYDIESYKVSWNQKITANGVKYLLELFPNLRSIDITGTIFADHSESYKYLFMRKLLVYNNMALTCGLDPSLQSIENNYGYQEPNREAQILQYCKEYSWEPIYDRGYLTYFRRIQLNTN